MIQHSKKGRDTNSNSKRGMRKTKKFMRQAFYRTIKSVPVQYRLRRKWDVRMPFTTSTDFMVPWEKLNPNNV
jgi:hypothetical protein